MPVMIYHFKTTFMNEHFTNLKNMADGALSLTDKKQPAREVNQLFLLSFNDVKSCCHDDSAGGGCLYLDEEKLKEIVRARS
jgi:hypothetical protein